MNARKKTGSAVYAEPVELQRRFIVAD